jgi:hypothetical protein
VAHPYHHAVRSARLFGGKPEDYLAIHDWFDQSKRRARLVGAPAREPVMAPQPVVAR